VRFSGILAHGALGGLQLGFAAVQLGHFLGQLAICIGQARAPGES
jgi:hypothetical protein